MAAIQTHVVPIFAMPFGVATLPGTEALNPAVATLFAERATPGRADPAYRQTLTFQSRPDLLDWGDAPVRTLSADIIAGVLSAARAINEFTDEKFASFQVQARAWYTIVHADGCVPSRNYPNAAWCAIYCVAAPPESTTRFDSGVLRLHDSTRPTMFSDATTSTALLPYRPAHNTWRPVPGQVAVFPAALTHEIALLRAAGELVLITALVRFVAPGQTGMPWW